MGQTSSTSVCPGAGVRGTAPSPTTTALGPKAAIRGEQRPMPAMRWSASCCHKLLQCHILFDVIEETDEDIASSPEVVVLLAIVLLVVFVVLNIF